MVSCGSLKGLRTDYGLDRLAGLILSIWGASGDEILLTSTRSHSKGITAPLSSASRSLPTIEILIYSIPTPPPLLSHQPNPLNNKSQTQSSKSNPSFFIQTITPRQRHHGHVPRKRIRRKRRLSHGEENTSQLAWRDTDRERGTLHIIHLGAKDRSQRKQ